MSLFPRLLDFWDAVRVEKTLVSDALKKGFNQGIEKSIENEKIEIAKRMLRKGFSIDDVCTMTTLNRDMVISLM